MQQAAVPVGGAQQQGNGGGVSTTPAASTQQGAPTQSTTSPQQTQPQTTSEVPQQQQQQQQQPRFEDLTIDDDLPLLPRLQRYVQSSIALQRLVHVRMLGEVSQQIGQQLTATELVPLLPPLVNDGESIIRQRLCSEIKMLCLVLMGMTTPNSKDQSTSATNNNNNNSSLPSIPKPNKSSKYYKVMTHHIIPHLYTLISDPDNEVRRSASENIVKLALRVDVNDVVNLILSIPLRLVKEGQLRASNPNSESTAVTADGKVGNNNNTQQDKLVNSQTSAEDLLITASNLLADLSSFLPPTRLSSEITSKYLSPTILSLADDPNFRVRRAATQALPRMLGSSTMEDVKRKLLPKFVSLSGDEMYRVRKASGECLVDVSRALSVLPWRLHFDDVWIHQQQQEQDGQSVSEENEKNYEYYKPRTSQQIETLNKTIQECHEIRRRALCAISKKLLEDTNKFVRYGMMQFLGPLIASFYPLDRGSMIGCMGGLLYETTDRGNNSGGEKKNDGKKKSKMGKLGIGVESIDIAKCSTGLQRVTLPSQRAKSLSSSEISTIENILSYNHSLHGLELILHGESSLNHGILPYGGGCNANKDPFGTMGPQFFPHANGMVGRSSALDDDDTDSFLVKSYLDKCNPQSGVPDVISSSQSLAPSPRALLPKFVLESRSDALALTRIVWHRTGRIPTDTSTSTTLPYPLLMSGKPDPEDLKLIASTLLIPFIAMASCQTGEETTDAEMRVYCAYSLPAVILLFGGANWEKDGLKRCFLELIGRIKPENDIGENGAENPSPNIIPPGPPLPVKRCLASSVHAVAHMLGPDVVSKDPAFLSAFEKSFLRDPDEAIRLNILKNLASFLGALPPGDGPGHRNAYLPMLQSIIMGDDVLGAAKRRSASNPGVLNWRQRDAVAKVLPDLIVLFDAQLNRQFMWPILKALLTDSVSAVRENAGWSVPVLLRKYTSNDDENELLTCLSEVTTWLRETFLGEGCDSSNGESSSRLNNSFRQLKKKKQMASSEGAFSKRQGYCRILAAVSLAMRMGEGGTVSLDDTLDITSQSNGKNMPHVPVDPYGIMTQYERDHFRVLLLRDLLPPALEMAVDCVANVRLTLTKCLKVLPLDVRQEGHVEDVLSTLEEELMTWDVGAGDMPLADSGLVGSGIVGGVASSSDPPAVTMTSTMSSC